MCWRFTFAVLLLSLSSGILCNPSLSQSSGHRNMMLHVAVTASGGFASGINPKSFVVYDNGTAQDIIVFKDGSVPASIAIVMDTTEALRMARMQKGNMALALVANGLLEFTRLTGQNEYCLVGFNQQASLLIDWTQNVSAVASGVSSIKAKGNQAALYDACLMGLELLAKRSNGKRVLIVITGGLENKSRHKFEELRRVVKGSDALVYPIGFEDSFGSGSAYRIDPQLRSELEQLAELSGGLFRISYLPEQIKEDLGKLTDELQRQYLIGFEYTNNTSLGTYHRLEIKLRPVGNTENELKGLRVRSRQGYVPE